MKIIYAPRALRDLHHIDGYLQKHSPASARQILAAIKSSVETLAAFFPQLGPAANLAGHRRLPVRRYPYLSFYRVAQMEIIVLHIRHTSRQPYAAAEDQG